MFGRITVLSILECSILPRNGTKVLSGWYERTELVGADLGAVSEQSSILQGSRAVDSRETQFLISFTSTIPLP
jgi:hypothetical protein